MILNLTPRVIRIYATDRPDGIDDLDLGLRQTLDPESQYAVLDAIPVGSTYRDDIPVQLVEYGHADHLPAPRDGGPYVVARAGGLPLAPPPRRSDLLIPYREVRTSDGTVIGCRELAQPV